MYVRRPLNMNEALFSTMGPSTMNFEARMDTFAVPWTSFMFPSFMFTSSTDDRRPPKRAGNPPLVMVICLTASELNTEKKPKRWLTL